MNSTNLEVVVRMPEGGRVVLRSPEDSSLGALGSHTHPESLVRMCDTCEHVGSYMYM